MLTYSRLGGLYNYFRHQDANWTLILSVLLILTNAMLTYCVVIFHYEIAWNGIAKPRSVKAMTFTNNVNSNNQVFSHMTKSYIYFFSKVKPIKIPLFVLSIHLVGSDFTILFLFEETLRVPCCRVLRRFCGCFFHPVKFKHAVLDSHDLDYQEW